MLEYICYPSKKKVRISKMKYIRDRDGNYTQLYSLNTQFIRIWMLGVLYPATQRRLASEVRRAPWRRMWKILRLNRTEKRSQADCPAEPKSVSHLRPS